MSNTKPTIIWGTEQDNYNYVLRNANKIINDRRCRGKKPLRTALNMLEAMNKGAILN